MEKEELLRSQLLLPIFKEPGENHEIQKNSCVYNSEGARKDIYLKYCPFCGTQVTLTDEPGK